MFKTTLLASVAAFGLAGALFMLPAQGHVAEGIGVVGAAPTTAAPAARQSPMILAQADEADGKKKAKKKAPKKKKDADDKGDGDKKKKKAPAKKKKAADE